MKHCQVWDLDSKAQAPLPKKWHYSFHTATSIVFFSVESEKKFKYAVGRSVSSHLHKYTVIPFIVFQVALICRMYLLLCRYSSEELGQASIAVAVAIIAKHNIKTTKDVYKMLIMLLPY
jgi:hypothetical protein